MSEPIEPDELPILPVIIEALTLPIRHLIASLASVGVAVAALGVALGLAWLLFGNPFGGGSPFEAAGPVWLLVAVFILGAAAVLVGIFNLWARIGVMGAPEAWQQSTGQWARQITSNMVNFLWIGIVVGLVAGLIMVVFMAVFGTMLVPLGQGFMGDAISGNSLWLMGVLVLLLGIPYIWLVCYLYARFSFTIVEGALGERYVSSSRPREAVSGGALRFSIVLAVVYVAGELVNAFVAPVAVVPGLSWLTTVIEVGLYLYGVAVIGAAHGISFRLKTGRSGTLGDQIAAAEVAGD